VPTIHSALPSQFRNDSIDGVQIADVTIPKTGTYHVHTTSTVGKKIAIGTYDPSVTGVFVAIGLGVVTLICLIFTPWKNRRATSGRPEDVPQA
jgi:hypothetical protein